MMKVERTEKQLRKVHVGGWVLWRGLPREVFDLPNIPNTLYDLVTENVFFFIVNLVINS